jgi:two-component system, NarL family, nitrate/nitrite response regulator NarL
VEVDKLGKEQNVEHLDTITVAACETQPVTAEGLRSLLATAAEFVSLGSVSSLGEAAELMRAQNPGILVVDKAFGVQVVLEWIAERRSAGPATQIVVWGLSITEAEALRFLQIGARGIVRKTTDPDTLLACLRTVASGASWMEDCLFREPARHERYHRSELTPRELQVMELVEQGYKNKEIARQLGIRPGTVKIHLKHIFEKTGVRGRYGLALSGMKEKGLLALP